MRGEPINIIEMAECNEWELIDEQPNSYMLSFSKNGNRINVYYSKMTVAVCHNKKTDYFRRVTENELSNIFIHLHPRKALK